MHEQVSTVLEVPGHNRRVGDSGVYRSKSDQNPPSQTYSALSASFRPLIHTLIPVFVSKLSVSLCPGAHSI